MKTLVRWNNVPPPATAQRNNASARPAAAGGGGKVRKMTINRTEGSGMKKLVGGWNERRPPDPVGRNGSKFDDAFNNGGGEVGPLEGQTLTRVTTPAGHGVHPTVAAPILTETAGDECRNYVEIYRRKEDPTTLFEARNRYCRVLLKLTSSRLEIVRLTFYNSRRADVKFVCRLFSDTAPGPLVDIACDNLDVRGQGFDLDIPDGDYMVECQFHARRAI